MTARPKTSRLRRWLRRGLIGCAVLTIVVVAIAWALWHNDQQVQVTISPETTWIVEPLRDDGYVDYVAALNQHASQGVTLENNAVVLFCRAMGPKAIHKATSETFFELLGIEPLAAEGEYFVTFDRYLDEQRPEIDVEEQETLEEEFVQAAKRPWSKKDLPLLAQWLAANENPLQLVVEGTRRPRCYWPMVGAVEDTSLMAVLLPGMEGCREFARGLCIRAMRHAQSGRFDDARADLMACHRLARLASRGPTLVEGLVATKIEWMACAADAALAHRGDLSAEQAKLFAADLANLSPLEGFADKIDVADRYMYLDSMCLIARKGPAAANEWSVGEAEESLENTIQRCLLNQYVDWDQVLMMAHPWFDDMAAASRKPTRSERSEAMDEIMVRLDAIDSNFEERPSLLKRLPFPSNSDAVGNIFISLMLPAMGAINDAADKATARLEMTRIAFALAVFRAENGSYPAKLADLGPKYLAQVPKDIFSDGEFRYEAIEGGYRLWSIGLNGRDDGGEGPDVEDYEGDGDDLLIATPKRE